MCLNIAAAIEALCSALRCGLFNGMVWYSMAWHGMGRDGMEGGLEHNGGLGGGVWDRNTRDVSLFHCLECFNLLDEESSLLQDHAYIPLESFLGYSSLSVFFFLLLFSSPFNFSSCLVIFFSSLHHHLVVVVVVVAGGTVKGSGGKKNLG